jgi:alanine dehydrogenase
MIIGIPKEIKKEEYRVGITPDGVRELKAKGHTLLIEAGAGEGSGFSDEEYLKADADIVDKKSLFKKSELIVKVKEPLASEYELLEERHILFTYLHLAPNRILTELLLKNKVASIGYETLQKDGALPLLAPMSEIAGRMAPLMGAYFLQKIHHGSGILPSGTPGVKPAKCLILGAGVVGFNAARIAFGLAMDTTIMNRGIERLRKIDEFFSGRVKTLPLNNSCLMEEIKSADIIIGAVLVPGGKTPVLIKKDMLKTMKKGSVIVDVSIDQGGCAETSKASFHNKPLYEIDGILHYTVANMPGAYPRTSTLALTNATLQYIKIIADKGLEKAAAGDTSIMSAVNTYKGHVTHKALSKAYGIDCTPLEKLI